MNQEINYSSRKFSRPGCTLHPAPSTEQANRFPLVKVSDVIAQPVVPVCSANFGWKEVVNINNRNSEDGTCSDDHNFVLGYRGLLPGVSQAAFVNRITSDCRLHAQEFSITSDTQAHETDTRGDLITLLNPCCQRVQCSSSSISADVKREFSGVEAPVDRLHVSSCAGIKTFELLSKHSLSKQRLLEFEKTSEAVSNKHSVCGSGAGFYCPANQLTSAETRTQHFDLSKDLQYNTSFSNLDFYSSSKICIDNSNDETLRYRTDIREQCKRHHNLKLHTAANNETSVKNTFVLKDVDNLGFPSYILTPQGTHSGENWHSRNSHGRTHKSRHRKKHEIGRNTLSENKATTLRLNISETGDPRRPSQQNKDFSAFSHSNLCVTSPLFSSHKESPRARFERDRAARNNAISGKSDSIRNSVTAVCINEPKTAIKQQESARYAAIKKCDVADIESVLFKSTQLKCLAPIQRSIFDNISSSVNEDTALNQSHGSAALQLSSITNNNGCAQLLNNGFVESNSELKQTISDTGNTNQRFAQSTFTSKARLLDTSKPDFVECDLPAKFTRCSALQNNSLCESTSKSEEESWDRIYNIDETPAQVGESVNTSLPIGSGVKSCVPVLDNNDIVNKNCVRNTACCAQVGTRNTETPVNFSSVFYSQDRNTWDITSNNSRRHRTEAKTLPTNLTQLCLQENPADAFPRSLLECGISPAVRHTHRRREINEDLPVLGHQSPLKCVRDFNSVPRSASTADSNVFYQESAIESSSGAIENRLNANIKSLHQTRSRTSNACTVDKLPESTTAEHLDHITQFVNNLFREGNAESYQTPKYKCAVKPLQCAESQKEINNLSLSEITTSKCDSALSENTSRVINNASMTHKPVSSGDSQETTHHTQNNTLTSSISSYNSCAPMNSSGKKMLASRGLRIYDYVTDCNAVLNPTKSPHLKSTSASTFQWEGTTYLILPTVLDSLTGPSVKDPSNVAAIAKTEHLTQRSISDSGVVTHSCVNNSDRSNTLLANDNDKDIVNIEDTSLSTSSRNRRLSFRHRSLSVDVLCAEADSNIGFSSVPADPHNISEDNINAGRGYVEWKTCSTWLRKPDTDINEGQDSRGYVEWDTIWTTAPPWMGEGKDDEHLYDSVGDYNSYSSNENLIDLPHEELHISANTNETPFNEDLHNLQVTTETPPSEGVHNLPVTAETPPALPERTYISRLKKCNNAELSPSCLEKQNSKQHHRHHHHHHHHDISNLRKYHNHYHHNHKSNTQKHLSATSPTQAPIAGPGKYSSSVFPKQCKHISVSSENGLRPVASNHDPNASDEFQNYATVHKLRGYRFNNITTSSERPVPHPRGQTAISSENYCHLAPLTSKESMISLQTSDLLDYIDGLHDSMSPKRRENIYLLLNNKQTRAKFSESLEIESRLLSKGLISGSNVGDVLEDTLRESKTVCSDATQGMFKFKVPQRQGAFAPVSSTYV